MRLSDKVTEIGARSKSEGSVVSLYSMICPVKGMLIPWRLLKEMTTEREVAITEWRKPGERRKEIWWDMSESWSVKALVWATMAEEQAKLKAGSGTAPLIPNGASCSQGEQRSQILSLPGSMPMGWRGQSIPPFNSRNSKTGSSPCQKWWRI